MRNQAILRRALIAASLILMLVILLITRAAKRAEKAEEGGLSAGQTASEEDVSEGQAAEPLQLPGILSPGNVHPAANLLNTDTQFYSYNDEGSTLTAAVGIDVSEYQGEVDYQKVREAGIQFVIIRIAYQGYVTGKMVVDSNFYRNYEGAHAAGLPVGVYFFSSASTRRSARPALSWRRWTTSSPSCPSSMIMRSITRIPPAPRTSPSTVPQPARSRSVKSSGMRDTRPWFT